jgi:membrane protease YdiL (CAAX protease family)
LERNPSGRSLLAAAIIAGILFLLLFTFGGRYGLDFWWWLSLNIAILLILSLILDPDYLAYLKNDAARHTIMKIAAGIGSAIVLYLVFWSGNYLSTRILPFSELQIGEVYSLKTSVSSVRIAILMVLIIGPGEELFWRGFLQRQLHHRFSAFKGFLITNLLYTMVHIPSGNPMLILAAMVCGFFWGWLYMRHQSVLLNCISHTLWDMAVFIYFPFQ